MTSYLVLAAFVAAFALVVLRPQKAGAHCDTMDGPAVRDGRLALETGNLAHALKWVEPAAEAELGDVFAKAVPVRALGDEAREVADRWFLENLVRVHRAGEGEPFTGLQPSGASVDPRVAAADAAIQAGTLEPLHGLVPADQLPELRRRLELVLARRQYDVDDVAAGRAYIEAYVQFFTLAEGHHAGHHDGHHDPALEGHGDASAHGHQH